MRTARCRLRAFARSRSLLFPIATLLALLALPGCMGEAARVTPASSDPPPAYHLHLPGIGGYRSIDRRLLEGLRAGGVDAQLEPYDWTENNAGLGALLATGRHKTESEKVARMIVQHAREHPNARLTVTVHSGGAGIIVWALEQLPDDVKIDELVMLAPALSPQYDLTRALRHVRGKAYAFYSPHDTAVLGIGTRMLGTIDGVKTDASGRVGFARPDGADEREYEKLVQVPYDAQWADLGNIGDHIGTLSGPFARDVLAPLLRTGRLPETHPGDAITIPTTVPSGAPPDDPPGATASHRETPAMPTTAPMAEQGAPEHGSSATVTPGATLHESSSSTIPPPRAVPATTREAPAPGR